MIIGGIHINYEYYLGILAHMPIKILRTAAVKVTRHLAWFHFLFIISIFTSFEQNEVIGEALQGTICSSHDLKIALYRRTALKNKPL
jgi:hypothetical protein